jgi:hypothetical protein
MIELTPYQHEQEGKEEEEEEEGQFSSEMELFTIESSISEQFEHQERIVWFQRMKYLTLILIMVFVCLSLFRTIGAMISLQLFVGRYFLWLPFSLELLLSLIFSFACRFHFLS